MTCCDDVNQEMIYIGPEIFQLLGFQNENPENSVIVTLLKYQM